ncbi:MAG TPA: hypothetical protein VMW30_04775 [Candidatus Paceibacterota bacterium]|nr:hypothetical protein [Candidatus Paceibacterota bacterium]
MNETKSSWMSFLAWPVVGATLAVSVLGAMTIGLYVLPLAIAALFALLRWGGNRKSSVGLISGAGLPFLYIAFLNRHGPADIVCRLYADGGQQCAQEFSPWPLLIIGTILVLLGMLLFVRLRSGSTMSSRSTGLWTLTLVVSVIFTRLIATPASIPPIATESGRIQNAFNEMSVVVIKKEGVPAPWLTPVHAGTVSTLDGSKVSLWVPKPSPLGIRSNCFYVEERRKGGSSGLTENSCIVPKSEVILERQGFVVIGFVRMTKANFATITSNGVTLKAPITFGYFIVPSALSGDPKGKFAISFIDPGGATCKVADLPAPGDSASIQCVIA